MALAEAKRTGCRYADIRFTRRTNSSVNATGGNSDLRGLRRLRWAAGGRRRTRRRRGGGGGGGGGGFGGADETAGRGAAGFGVRVIHSGVWGFASSPIVTEDEIRRITRIATEVAKASAIAKQRDVVLAPVRAYTEYWATPVQKNPDTISREDKQALVQHVVDIAVKNKDVVNVNASVGDRARVEVLRQLGGLVHRAGGLVVPTRRSPSPRARTARPGRAPTPAR